MPRRSEASRKPIPTYEHLNRAPVQKPCRSRRRVGGGALAVSYAELYRLCLIISAVSPSFAKDDPNESWDLADEIKKP